MLKIMNVATIAFLIRFKIEFAEKLPDHADSPGTAWAADVDILPRGQTLQPEQQRVTCGFLPDDRRRRTDVLGGFKRQVFMRAIPTELFGIELRGVFPCHGATVENEVQNGVVPI